MTVLCTGARGFIGRNLVARLRVDGAHRVIGTDVDTTPAELAGGLAEADIVFHLAGVNRPRDPADFDRVNAGLTRSIVQALALRADPPPVVLASSTQAATDNPYGRSKRAAEDILAWYAKEARARAVICRFPNVFGKWCRPDYNSVVATFCHNAARGLPLEVRDPAVELRLLYIDDLVDLLVGMLAAEDRLGTPGEPRFLDFPVTFRVTLGDLARTVSTFRETRARRVIPDLGDPLVRRLYSTFLAALDPSDLAQQADMKNDARGWLFELVKSPSAGQVFVSTTHPGVTRGNHYHDTKTEIFCVVRGRATIRLRRVDDVTVHAYEVDGAAVRMVAIPPGYTHSITNTGTEDMVALFWASEVFSAEAPDTYPLEVTP